MSCNCNLLSDKTLAKWSTLCLAKNNCHDSMNQKNLINTWIKKSISIYVFILVELQTTKLRYAKSVKIYKKGV